MSTTADRAVKASPTGGLRPALTALPAHRPALKLYLAASRYRLHAGCTPTNGPDRVGLAADTVLTKPAPSGMPIPGMRHGDLLWLLDVALTGWDRPQPTVTEVTLDEDPYPRVWRFPSVGTLLRAFVSQALPSRWPSPHAQPDVRALGNTNLVPRSD